MCIRDSAYPMQFTEQEQKQFENGICYSIYEKLGAHPVKIDGISGVYFAVWAPNAIRVSVVGNFNNWDGRAYQMNLLESGIYELFIPGVRAGDIYKYEIKAKGGLTYLKSDQMCIRDRTVTGWLAIAYFIRTQVVIIRDREYNLASKCLGTSIFRIAMKNILPFMTDVYKRQGSYY